MSGITWLDPAAQAAFARLHLATLDDLAAFAGGTIVTTARTRSLRRLELDGRVWFLKVQDLRRAPLRLRKLPSYLLRGSQVAREAQSLAVLRSLGFRTPDVAAFGSRRRLLLPELAVLVTAELPGYVDLARYLGQTPPPADAVRAIDAAESLVANVHAAGYALMGAKYRNILLPAAGLTSATELALLDQPDLRRTTAARLRAKDHALLRRDRARFGGRA